MRPYQLVWQQTGDEVVLDLKTSTYLAINETGRTLWPALQDGATLDELAVLLAERHGVGDAVARADAAAFVAALGQHDLLAD